MEAQISGIAVENIVERAEAEGFPPEPLGLLAADATTYRAVLALADTEKARAIQDGLDAIRARRWAREDEEQRRHARAVAAGLEQPTLEEQRERDDANAEARAAYERHVQERPERIERMLSEIRDALVKR